MSIQAIVWVLEFSESEKGPRHVLISIANHADREGLNSYPSVATIAFESRLSEREVQYSLNTLSELGELVVQKSQGPKGTNLYSLPKIANSGILNKMVTGANSAPSNQLRGAKKHEKTRNFAPEPSSLERESNNTLSVGVQKPEGGEVDLEQKLLPWMEAQWRNHPSCWKRKWKSPKYPDSFARAEQAEGAQSFRQAFMDYLQSAEEPSVVDFLYSRRDASGGNGGGHRGGRQPKPKFNPEEYKKHLASVLK